MDASSLPFYDKDQQETLIGRSSWPLSVTVAAALNVK